MASHPFAAFMQSWAQGGPFAAGPQPLPMGMPFGQMPADGQFEQLARQYWTAWGEAMRAAGGPRQAAPGVTGWHEVVDWWSRLAHGNRSEVNSAVERFNAQARNWFGQMQQVAAQLAGQDHSAGDIVEAWKRALGASGENPFPDVFQAMRGHGLQGLDQWIQDASPYLETFRRESAQWLSMPAFGIAREHQERLQALAQAQMDYQDKASAWNALMAKVGQNAFEVFERKLAMHEEPGRQLTSARALFDVWIDAAEDAYAELALSQEFQEVYGALVNAQMRLRNGIQKEVEQVCGVFGMPTRTEIDSAHRKIAELERQVRRLRNAGSTPGTDNAGGNAGNAARPAGARPGTPAARKTARAAKTIKTTKATKTTKTTKKASPRPAGKRTGKAAARARSGDARKTGSVALLDIATPLAPGPASDGASRPGAGRTTPSRRTGNKRAGKHGGSKRT